MICAPAQAPGRPPGAPSIRGAWPGAGNCIIFALDISSEPVSYTHLEAVADGTTVPLYDGMPIWSVYFYDLTGDGNPELCSTISFGSGIIDDRIIIYDYAGGASYELSDRGNFDYVLNMQEDSLIVEKRAYMQDELIESGELVFLNGTIQIKTE